MKIILFRLNSVNSYLLYVALFFAVASCSKKQEAQEDTLAINQSVVTLTPAQFENAAIAVGKMEQKNISQVLRVNGKIDVPPQNMVSVSVPLGGYLKSTKLLPGMHLTKGESIAIMEDQQYIQLQQEFLTARTKLNFTANEYQRQKELNQSKATSDKIFQQTEVDYLTGKIDVNALGEKLELIGINPEQLNENTISKSINLYAPINGYVSKVNVNIGKYTQPSEVLFELINPSDIHLALTIFEKDLNKLSIGQKLIAYTNGQPDRMHACEIIFIGKDLSAGGSTVVHCHFENYDKSLVPGMYMNAIIELDNNKARVLPEEAIVRFENKHYAFLVKGETEFEIKEIEIGNTENGFTEIVSGSQFSDKLFVTKGAYHLLMKMKNKVDE